MPLSAGSRLGPYVIVAPLGAGGMGEVYRARDTKLNRDVAIKVLPEAFAADAERLARFQREVQVLAGLSHPNILSIFDFGSQEGTTYAVTELLEGETLRQKLASGPVSVSKALAWAQEIARGLAAAHAKGIVHRDLKPENVFVTRDGHVEILDFGLALQLTQPGDAADTHSPTRGLPTEPGAILGTVAYMSPEQARGLPADARSDIFALGGLLYELLCGRRAFSGASAVETMHAILRDEPAELPSGVRQAAGGLERVVRTCLAKEPGDRWQSAADLAREIAWLSEERARPGAARAVSTPWLPWGFAGLGAVIAAAALLLSRGGSGGDGPVVQFAVPSPEGTELDRNVLGLSFAPSPDGRSIVFMTNSSGLAALWLWSVAEATATRLPDTDGAISPFWSPDGLSVAFFADGKLKRIAVSGGPAQVLSDAPYGHAGSWGTQGLILFSEWTGEGEGIHSVPADGGKATKLQLTDEAGAEVARAWPTFLPDGTHFLYLAGVHRGPAENYRVCVGQLTSPKGTCLMQSDTRVEYANPGRLLFARRGTLLAQTFDVEKRRVSGEPIPVVAGLSVFAPTGGADFAVSADGRLVVYRLGAPASRLVWMDRSGRHVGAVGQPGYFGLVRISPDGRRLAVDVEDPKTGGRDIWLYDLLTGIGSQLTFDPVDAGWPVWSPDGSRLAFGSGGKGPPDIYVKDLGGRLEETLAFAAPSTQYPVDWTRDGRFIAYVDYSPTRRAQKQILILPMSGERKPVPLAGSVSTEYDPRFSPDSRWIAFATEESGQTEVYVAAVNGTGRRQRVSPAGGSLPCWSRDGKELFYVSAASDLMAAQVTSGPELQFSQPKPLFSLPPFPFRFRSDYDVSLDGQRFLVNLGTERAHQPPLTAIMGWQQQLGIVSSKRR